MWFVVGCENREPHCNVLSKFAIEKVLIVKNMKNLENKNMQIAFFKQKSSTEVF